MKLRFQWKFSLDVEPERLWQYIADTGSLNEAAGLPAWKLQYIPEDDGGSRQVGEARYIWAGASSGTSTPSSRSKVGNSKS